MVSLVLPNGQTLCEEVIHFLDLAHGFSCIAYRSQVFDQQRKRFGFDDMNTSSLLVISTMCREYIPADLI